MRSLVAHLESAIDATRFPVGELNTIHAGRPLWVRYDLPSIAAEVSRDQIAQRQPSLWRYRELLPLPLDIEPITLGEGMTPLVPCPRIGQQLGLRRLLDRK